MEYRKQHLSEIPDRGGGIKKAATRVTASNNIMVARRFPVLFDYIEFPGLHQVTPVVP